MASWKTGVFSGPGSTVDAFSRQYALFRTCFTSRWTSYPVRSVALSNTGKLVGLGDDVTMLPCAAQCSVCGTFSASVYGVKEFHVFLRRKRTSDPVVDPRLQNCDFTTFVGVFDAPWLLL